MKKNIKKIVYIINIVISIIILSFLIVQLGYALGWSFLPYSENSWLVLSCLGIVVIGVIAHIVVLSVMKIALDSFDINFTFFYYFDAVILSFSGSLLLLFIWM